MDNCTLYNTFWRGTYVKSTMQIAGHREQLTIIMQVKEKYIPMCITLYNREIISKLK